MSISIAKEKKKADIVHLLSEFSLISQINMQASHSGVCLFALKCCNYSPRSKTSGNWNLHTWALAMGAWNSQLQPWAEAPACVSFQG